MYEIEGVYEYILGSKVVSLSPPSRGRRVNDEVSDVCTV